MTNTDTNVVVESSVYEVPIKLKLSSKKILYGVLMPLIILVLFYCVCCLEIMQKIGFQVAFKYSIPLMIVGSIIGIYFKTHTTKKSAKFEFCEQWVSYTEDDIISGQATYRINSIKKVKRSNKGVIIYGEVDRIRVNVCETQKSLTIDLPISKDICKRLTEYKDKYTESGEAV